MKEYLLSLQSTLFNGKPKKTKLLKSKYNHRIISLNSILLLLIFYFAFHSLSGERGVFALIRLSKEYTEKNLILEDILSQKEILQNRVQLLYPKSLDLDLLDEVARNDLGLIAKEEKAVIQPR